jgi:hypothetical protein
MGAIVALGGMVSLPWIGRVLGFRAALQVVAALILAWILLVGGFLGVFGAGFMSGAVMAEVEDALSLLEEHFLNAPREEVRRAVVRILWDAHFSAGPTTISTFDFDDAKVRLGEALPYVQAVERFLLAESSIYPVFTRATLR